ncbi:MAG: hypothetical protein IPK16_15230 [Anaerolineales bacterium]|nr:hypothetical protein [Anaerolineales bacterium]
MQTVNDGNPQSVPMQIVIVTPTPGAVRALSIAGVLVDRPLAVTGGEQTMDVSAVEPAVASNPGAGELPASQFDLASLVVPPMVEEVVNGPLAQVQVIPLPGLEPKITPVPTLVEAPPTPTPLGRSGHSGR